jgi:hypothetical protein
MRINVKYAKKKTMNIFSAKDAMRVGSSLSENSLRAPVTQRSRIWLLSACMHNVNSIMFLHFGLARMRRPTLKKEHQENGFWSRSHDLQLPACFACLRAPASLHTTIFIAIRSIRAQNYYTVLSLCKRRGGTTPTLRKEHAPPKQQIQLVSVVALTRCFCSIYAAWNMKIRKGFRILNSVPNYCTFYCNLLSSLVNTESFEISNKVR